MKYHELNVSRQKTVTRVGRGISAGQGKTAGRGTKGQKARKSGRVRPGFEGGQTTLSMRLPKLRGFRSNRPQVEEVYTADLEKLGVKLVDNYILVEKGLINNAYNPAKLLYNGDMSKAVSVKLQGASAKAIETVQKAGGTFERVKRNQRATTTKTEQ